MKRPDERWRTRGCPGTPHLSWDKRGPVSPKVLTLHCPRMLRGWQIVRGRRWREGEGRGLWLFIKESDNKIKRLQRSGEAWPYPATYGSAAASLCSSRNFTLLNDRTIKFWHISERNHKKRKRQTIRGGRGPPVGGLTNHPADFCGI